MGIFIKVELDDRKCKGLKECGKCVDTCPVRIFLIEKEKININSENEDECTLCNLCLEICPSEAIAVRKLYELEEKGR
ncbi:ferredoxin [Candidatus Aerophobetes bacterium Ae_b3a]|nr:MAG: ferredoxin [Candidatus Aerophobetes bacterium Ae_b3a]